MAKKKTSRRKPKTPWEKPNPRKRSTKLSPKQKSAAKSRAKRAGRSYPNLVDNMRAAAGKKKRAKK